MRLVAPPYELHKLLPLCRGENGDVPSGCFLAAVLGCRTPVPAGTRGDLLFRVSQAQLLRVRRSYFSDQAGRFLGPVGLCLFGDCGNKVDGLFGQHQAQRDLLTSAWAKVSSTARPRM